MFELLCVLAALVGVWLIYPPAALILGGLVGVLAAEAAAADRAPGKKEGG
ncbi:hypothetical protein ACFW4X_10825 [Streptomyces smyrnaeus]